MKSYYVSYSHSTGFGCCEITRSTVSSMSDIRILSEQIEEKSKQKNQPIKDVIILNWRLFENPSDAV